MADANDTSPQRTTRFRWGLSARTPRILREKAPLRNDSGIPTQQQPCPGGGWAWLEQAEQGRTSCTARRLSVRRSQFAVSTGILSRRAPAPGVLGICKQGTQQLDAFAIVHHCLDPA